MKQTKRLMAPGFLNRIDAWLLLNKPETWSARTHLVLYYGGAFIVLLALLTYIFPDDPRTSSGVANWALFTTIISIIGLVVWIIYLLRFNVFKRYGITNGWSRLKTFLLYFVATGIIITIPFVQGFVESCKANAAYKDHELVNDVNNINTKIVQLEFDSLNHTWSRDTLTVDNKLPVVSASSDDYTTTTTDVVYEGKRNKPSIDSASFRKRQAVADSSEKINDSTWVLLTAPRYVFTSVHGITQYSHVKQLESKDIYYSVVKNFQQPDAGKTRYDLMTLIEKYRSEENSFLYNYDNYHIDVISRKYFLTEVDDSFRNITDRKNRWRGFGLTVNINFFFYLTLSVSLLVFVFRHTTVKAFFLAMLASCVLTILSALVLAFIGYRGSSVLSTILFYFILFAGVSSYTFMSRTRHIVTGIAMNMFTVLLPFLPLVLVGIYDAIQSERHLYTGVSYNDDHLSSWYLFAQWAGPLIFLVLTATYIHNLYRKWYSLPEE